MGQSFRKNGHLEVKFNDDKTQVTATIYPAATGGEEVTASEIVEKLKSMGVTYGVREQAIREAIREVKYTHKAVGGVVIALGAIPQDGVDAKVKYTAPLEVLTKPLPKRSDGSGLTDWFALDAAKMVKADDELAVIIPPQPGTPGKTLTWPIQPVAPKPGKPSSLSAGQNVRVSDDGQHLYAAHDGYACLNGEQLLVHALKVVEENLVGDGHHFPYGLVLKSNAQQAQIRTGTFCAIKGAVLGCHIRAHGDVYLSHAVNTTIIATGNVYVFDSLKNCEVNTRKKLIGLGSSVLVGGSICATEGIHAITLGSEDFAATEVLTGIDHFSEWRIREIEEELKACEMNITRISQALKPFSALAVHDTLSDEKRELLARLQTQRRTQEMRIKELHNEKRAMTIAMKEKVTGEVTVARMAHPGVWVRIRAAAAQIEAPMESVRFVEGSGGKSVQAESYQKAA